MRTILPILLSVAAFAALSARAEAAPMCWGNLAGPTYVISCSNLAQASYQCLATFDVVSGSQRQHYDNSFEVKAASSGQVSAVPSPFSGMSVKGRNFGYSCNFLAKVNSGSSQTQSSGSSSSQQSGGSSSSSGSTGSGSNNATNSAGRSSSTTSGQ